MLEKESVHHSSELGAQDIANKTQTVSLLQSIERAKSEIMQFWPEDYRLGCNAALYFT